MTPFKSAFLFALCCVCTSAFGAQPITFSKAKKHLVKLYQANPQTQTFYCGCDIKWKGRKGSPDDDSCGYEPRNVVTKSGKVNARAKRIEWEHVMPAYWFGNQLQCWQDGGRKACRRNKQFQSMEGDLHNLRPAIGEINADRSNFRFSIIPGERRNYGQCNFEVDFKARKSEPPPRVRGDIARTYFYMADRYQLNLSRSEERLLTIWDKSDPADNWEKKRNSLIKAIQGNGNRFID